MTTDEEAQEGMLKLLSEGDISWYVPRLPPV